MSRRLACLALLGLLACAHARTTPSADIPLGQLPRTVVPTGYTLSLDIDPAKERFSGDVRIAVQVNTPTTLIWLHGRDFDVSTVQYVPPQGEPVHGKYEQVHHDGVVRLTFDHPLPAGPGTLHLTWTAPFDTQAAGLYRVHDGDADYAFTQFEAQWARKAFPCFDEPGFKVPFDVSVTAPAGQAAISNMPVASQDGAGHFHFQTTPPLPTYLIAFAVGPLDVVSGPDIPPNEVRSQPIPLRAVATHGKGKFLHYALERTGGLVTTLEKYFGVAYPYPKLDLIAVPDFGAGAMENAGAITFREFLLLVDEKTAPVDQKRGVVRVTMHELAHQWFGDLVTPKWWDDIWLNEAFASWMAARAVDIWGGPGERAGIDQLGGTQAAMNDDSRAAARQIRQPIHSRSDLDNAFDGITYSKGAGVIGMFERWVGEDTFRRGIHSYMEKYRYGNATTDDFLAAISEAAGKDVGTPFHTFLDQPGLPLVETKVTCGAGKPAVDFKVTRYAPLGSTINPDVQWQLPVCVRYEADGKTKSQCELVTRPTGTMTLEAERCPAWVLLNADAAGYFVFDLSTTEFQKLVAAKANLTEREQMAVAQSIAFAERAGRLPFSAALTDLEPFSEHASLRQFLDYSGRMFQFARDELVSESLRPKVEQSLAVVLQKSGALDPVMPLSKRSPDQQILLHSALAYASDVAHEQVLRALAARTGMAYLTGQPEEKAPFADILAQPAFLDVSLEAAMETEPEKVFDSTLARLKQASDPVERRNLLVALGFASGSYAERARGLVFDAGLRSTEAPTPLFVQASRHATREATWAWFTSHYDEIINHIPEGYLVRLPTLGGSFCSEERAVEVEQFFSPRVEKIPGGHRSLMNTLEQIRLCAAQVKAQREDAERLFGAK